MIRMLTFLVGLIGPIGLFAQDKNPNLDVTEYRYEVWLSDESDEITVEATLRFTVKKSTHTISFDLADRKADGTGMVIEKLELSDRKTTFRHTEDLVHLSVVAVPADTLKLWVRYSGVPANGLIIRKNKNDERTFFGDHWPNRAHHYLIGHDHLADKAIFKWNIHAPPGYQVVHSDTISPLPLKVSVFGVAPLKKTAISTKGIKQFAYGYPADSASVFQETEIASEIMSYFESIWGRYPFQQLNHVQSTTLFGGMENAGCIFYDERAISDGVNSEDLVAHEMAHQWFGNCVTESDWPHLWLSEGFATYGAHLFMQHKYGDSLFYSRLQADEKAILRRADAYPKASVIDYQSTDLMSRLNAYSYQKGGRILHMIRTDIGIEKFNKVLRAYFKKYQYQTASTNDFLNLLDEMNYESLSIRYKPWLMSPTIPELSWSYSVQPDQGIITLVVRQEQSEVMPMNLPVTLEFEDGSFEELTLKLQKAHTEQQWVFNRAVKSVQLDPRKDWLWIEAEP